jgi:small-conductance mechanosensitive channel
VLNRVWTLFKEHNVILPNPQRDIHIKDWPGPPPVVGENSEDGAENNRSG